MKNSAAKTNTAPILGHDLTLLQNNFRILTKDLEQLTFDLSPEANIARFSRSALRKTKSLITIHWKIVRKKGVLISLDQYKCMLKQYLLRRSDELQQARMNEYHGMVQAG